MRDLWLLSLGALAITAIAAAGGVWDVVVAGVGGAVHFVWPRTSE